nr:hypothetical protein [Tanacetum cinerariifolium]
MIFEGMVKNLDSEGSTVLVESHHTPSGAPTTSQPPLSSPFRIPSRQETEVPQPSSPTHTHVADEAASTGVDVRHGGAATTVSSLDAGQGSDSLEVDLKQTKKVYGAGYTKLIMNVKKLEKTIKSSQVRRRAKIVVSDDKELEDPSKQWRSMIEEIDQDEKFHLVTPTQQLKRLSFDELKHLFEATMKRVQTFTLMESDVDRTIPKIADKSLKRDVEEELEQESSKRQKTRKSSESREKEDDNLTQEDLQEIMMIVLVEEVFVEALQVKYPIIDWEFYTEESRKYWKIIRVGNHIETYQIFADMLKKFDQDELIKLLDLVKKRYSTTEPTDDKEKELWVELKRLFKPDTEDKL